MPSGSNITNPSGTLPSVNGPGRALLSPSTPEVGSTGRTVRRTALLEETAPAANCTLVVFTELVAVPPAAPMATTLESSGTSSTVPTAAWVKDCTVAERLAKV